MTEDEHFRICIVGAGTRFLGGISYYTIHAANALARTHDVSVILMRKLLPTRLYPGWKRVGANLTRLEYDPAVRVFDGVDWYWLPSMLRALLFLMKERPGTLVIQWWSGTVLHSYLLLALVARLLGVRIVIEFHEAQDPGEAKLPLAQIYVRLVAPLLVRLAHGCVIHSEYEKKLLQGHYDLEERLIAVIPHGPYNHYRSSEREQEQRIIPAACCNLLFFGLIRPYKGLEDLIMAFDSLPENEIARYWLTVVGETWEGWTLPTQLIHRSRYRERITFVNRYVSDAEVAEFFAGADAVVLPYHRSSSSGPLHIAMSCGLPVIVTGIGGLIEAVSDYEGALVVSPGDCASLRNALLKVVKLRGKRFTDPYSWENSSLLYHELFEALYSTSSKPGDRSKAHIREKR